MLNTSSYISSFKNYFWYWDEDGKVISLTIDNSTIAYTAYIIELVEILKNNSLPQLSSLLMILVAIDSPKERIDQIINAVRNNKSTVTIEQESIDFLKLLAQLPDNYKKGKNKKLLISTLFYKCHNHLSFKDAINAQRLLALLNNQEVTLEEQQILSDDLLRNHLKVISILASKLKTVDDIIQLVQNVPNFNDELELEPTEKEQAKQVDLLEDLLHNPKTYKIASLVKSIWAGLSIPFFDNNSQDRALGGYADLSNKGDFDKLLISEFANNDLVFLSRLANSEALFIKKENPPSNSNKQRIILIDSSIKNWGNPRIIAFAVLLALAKHPKNNFKCIAFSLATSYHEIHFSNANDVIQGLDELDVSLSASAGFSQFMEERHAATEIVYIGVDDAFYSAEFQSVWQKYKAQISFRISCDNSGTIKLFKNKNLSEKHLQTFELPIHQLWRNNKVKPQKSTQTDNTFPTNVPILVPNAPRNLADIIDVEGNWFVLTKHGSVLKTFDDALFGRETGFDILALNLNIKGDVFEIGLADDGNYYLLSFNKSNYKLQIFNLTNLSMVDLFFEDYSTFNQEPTNKGISSFLYHDNAFHYFTGTVEHLISLDGNLSRISNADLKVRNSIVKERKKQFEKIKSAFSVDNNVLRNISKVGINSEGNLVLNKHALILNPQNGLFWKPNKSKEFLKIADLASDNAFYFSNGTSILVNPLGIICIKPVDATFEDYIYIITQLDTRTALATTKYFTGKLKYKKAHLAKIKLSKLPKNRSKLKSFLEEFFVNAKISFQQFSLYKLHYSGVDEIELGYMDLVKSEELKRILQDKFRLECNLQTIDNKRDDLYVFEELNEVDFYSKIIKPTLDNILEHES